MEPLITENQHSKTMDFLTIVLGLILFLSFIYSLKLLICKRKNLPPGPKPLPIIGNLHLLGKQPHISLSKLANKYGDVMLLHLGFKHMVVISSAAMAKEVLQKQDLAFSSRSILNALHARNHFKYSVVFLPVGPRWRSLRKILNTNIFSSNRLDANQQLRRRKVDELIEYCEKSRKSGEAVDLGRAAFRTSLNILSNTIFSKDLEDPLSDSGKELKDVIEKIMVELGKPNLVDFYPFLEKFDPQGIRQRVNNYFTRVSMLLNSLIDERVAERNSKDGDIDDENVIDCLLTAMKDNPEDIDRNNIEAMCMDIFNAGTDTSSSTLEWAMAETLRNPEITKRVKDEIAQVIGKGKILDEKDVTRFPYLQCVVKETLRLHPPVPFLIPRVVEKDVDLGGYTITKNSQVFVNAWAIGRDVSTWVDPLEFKPERFLDSDIDVRGRDFELIPFGAGRRICPGLPLAMRVVTVMLGSLVNSFDWKLEGVIRPEELNMEERFGITLQKAYPLRAIPMCP